MLKPTSPLRPRPPLPGRKNPPRSRFLSREEEAALFKQFNAGGHRAVKARNTIVEDNQGLVITIAKQCHRSNLGLDFDDLVQEGNIGLLKAIDKFEHERGFKFSTFASWWIWQAISRAIMDKGDTIRVPVHIHNKIKRYCISLDTPVYKGESAGPTLHDRVAEKPFGLSETLGVIHVPLPHLIATLPPAEQRVLKLRAGLASDYPGVEMSLEDIGIELGGLSRQRVCQIEKNALDVLRERVANAYKLEPYAKWLNDEKALALMLPALSPEEQALFEITFYRWVTEKIAAKILGKPPAKISELRNELKRKLDKMYAASSFDVSLRTKKGRTRNAGVALRRAGILNDLLEAAQRYKKEHPEQKSVPVNAMSNKLKVCAATLYEVAEENKETFKARGIKFGPRDTEAAALAKIAEFKRELEKGKGTAPQTKEALCAGLGIARRTLANWERDSERAKIAIANLLPDNNAQRLDRLIEAAKKYRAAHPAQKLIPYDALINDTKIPKTSLWRLIKQNRELLRNKRIEFGPRDVESDALARIAEIRKRVEEEKEPVPKNKADLRKRLGIAKDTLHDWERSSAKIKKAVAGLIKIGKDTVGRLHRRESIPVEQRTALFAQGYNALAIPERDLGRDPVKIPEIAAAITYNKVSIRNHWIVNTPEIIGPDFVLYLQGRPEELVQEHRMRRIKWALNFARENNFNYLSLAEFSQARLNLCKERFRAWIKENPGVKTPLEEYPDVVKWR